MKVGVSQSLQDLTGPLGPPPGHAPHQEFFILGKDLPGHLLEVRVGGHRTTLRVEEGDIDGPDRVAVDELRNGPDVHIKGAGILIQDLFGLGGGDLLNRHSFGLLEKNYPPSTFSATYYSGGRKRGMSILKEIGATLVISAGLGLALILASIHIHFPVLEVHQRPVFFLGVVAFSVVVRGMMGIRQEK